jgi:hypothetical protein
MEDGNSGGQIGISTQFGLVDRFSLLEHCE